MPMLLNLTSTPIRIPRPENSRVNPASCVKLSVHYDSKTVNKTLPKEYELLGKALAHGPPQRIAKAILNYLTLKKLVIEKVLRLVCSEASDLCSRKEPSLLRKTGKSDIVNFSFQSLCEEWKTKAPIFYAFLRTVARSKNATWLPSVAVAVSPPQTEKYTNECNCHHTWHYAQDRIYRGQLDSIFKDEDYHFKS
ncbi:hypothetical protein QZH41_016897, partial [Actinostola sp. cb2023]